VAEICGRDGRVRCRTVGSAGDGRTGAVGSMGVAASVDSDCSVATDSGGAGGSSAMTIGWSGCV